MKWSSASAAGADLPQPAACDPTGLAEASSTTLCAGARAEDDSPGPLSCSTGVRSPVRCRAPAQPMLTRPESAIVVAAISNEIISDQ